MGHVEPSFNPFGDSVSVGAIEVHGLRQTYHGLKNHFGRTQRYSLVTRVQWKLVSVRLEIVLVLVQGSCTVCTKCTIGSEIVLDARDGTPW